MLALYHDVLYFVFMHCAFILLNRWIPAVGAWLTIFTCTVRNGGMKIGIKISGLTVAWCIACKHVDITKYPITNLINNSSVN